MSDPNHAPAALESAVDSLRALRPARPDLDIFKNPGEHLTAAEATLIRDLQHVSAASRVDTELRQLAQRTPYMQTQKGRAFMAKAMAILERLETLP